jgi:hypothetical protein
MTKKAVELVGAHGVGENPLKARVDNGSVTSAKPAGLTDSTESSAPQREQPQVSSSTSDAIDPRVVWG